ncbi:hypothetical protein Pla110_06690 [Polystyrenella longa]|uniref:Uncharacterized protein n=1 Tax=Polystyrenella longa TaxID=2528007 RepID=A0A518CIB8_9PLAN|nr:hypothetical protein [Polystyrenella longa]QDU78965.1 hypothetical protein Pla110_06690 [Polystyrenella longa]
MKPLFSLCCLAFIGCLQSSNLLDIPPEPAGNTRSLIATSLEGAAREDSLQIYGIYMAAADYIESDQLQAANAGELNQQIEKLFALSNWPTGKYPNFTKTHEEVLNPLLGSPHQTIMDRRTDIAALFIQIALGAKDAAR